MVYSLNLQDKKVLKLIYDFAETKKVKLYLVGGYLRDIVLKREKSNPDMDFAVKKGAIRFGREFAAKIKAGFVVLDKEHGSCRLLKRIQDKDYTLDFTDFRGRDLKEDLLLRDFTINSLALELEEAISQESLNNHLVDLYGGKQDLKKKIIRVLSKRSFPEDPLRILRAFSLACIFDFKIEKQTIKLINQEKEKLDGVSCERVRDELFKILDSDRAYDYLSYMHKLNVLKLIIPEIEVMRNVRQGPYHHLNVLAHSFESLRQMDLLIKACRNKEVEDYLNEYLCGQRKRRALIRLGVLLHDIGKPKTLRRRKGKTIFHGHERAGADIVRIIGRRLKLSNDELDALNKMVFWHLRPGYMADNLTLSARAKFRYFRDAGKEALSILLVSLADQRSTRGRLTSGETRQRHEKAVASLIKEYLKKKKEKKLPRLINGDDLIKNLRLRPSILIGVILSRVEELQAIGRIKTKQEALALAQRIKDKSL